MRPSGRDRTTRSQHQRVYFYGVRAKHICAKGDCSSPSATSLGTKSNRGKEKYHFEAAFLLGKERGRKKEEREEGEGKKTKTVKFSQATEVGRGKV